MPDLYLHCQYCGMSFKATPGDPTKDCRDHEAVCEKNLVNDKLKGVKVGDYVEVHRKDEKEKFFGVFVREDREYIRFGYYGDSSWIEFPKSSIQSITRLVPEVKLDRQIIKLNNDEVAIIKKSLRVLDENDYYYTSKNLGLIFKKLGVEV